MEHRIIRMSQMTLVGLPNYHVQTSSLHVGIKEGFLKVSLILFTLTRFLSTQLFLYFNSSKNSFNFQIP